MAKLETKNLKFAKQFCSICTTLSNLQVSLEMMCILYVAVVILPQEEKQSELWNIKNSSKHNFLYLNVIKQC